MQFVDVASGGLPLPFYPLPSLENPTFCAILELFLYMQHFKNGGNCELNKSNFFVVQ